MKHSVDQTCKTDILTYLLSVSKVDLQSVVEDQSPFSLKHLKADKALVPF